MPKGIQGFQKGNKFGKRFKPGKKFKINCLYCKKEFEISPWEKKENRKFCSRSCRSRFHAKFGEDHPRWKGGISNKWDSLHGSLEYREWRIGVFQRDRFKCQVCGVDKTRKNPIHAHHIKPKKTYPELILDLDNGLTLCKKCHVELHKAIHKSEKELKALHQGRHR